MTEPNRILVLRGGALGDFILTLPAIRLLRESFPRARLEIIAHKQFAALAELAGYPDATRSIESAGLASFFAPGGELTPEFAQYFRSFDLVVSYLFDPERIFARNLARAGVRNLIAGSPKITGVEHAALQLARPLEQINLHLENPILTLPLPQSVERDPRKIALHPGSGSDRKNWPLENFVELVRQLLQPNEKRKILLIGGEADHARVEKMKEILPNERLELAENISLPELALRLRGCQIFLGHDSGVSHLAAAVGVRCLLLFGPTDPAIWAPLGVRGRVLRAPSLTMGDIEVPQVLDSLGEFMS